MISDSRTTCSQIIERGESRVSFHFESLINDGFHEKVRPMKSAMVPGLISSNSVSAAFQ